MLYARLFTGTWDRPPGLFGESRGVPRIFMKNLRNAVGQTIAFCRLPLLAVRWSRPVEGFSILSRASSEPCFPASQIRKYVEMKRTGNLWPELISFHNRASCKTN